MTGDRERRRHARAAAHLAASLRVGGTLLPGTIVNLSRGGACLRTAARRLALRPGQGVVLTGAGPLRHGLDARVVGCSPGALRLAFDPSVTTALFFDPVALLGAAATDAA